MSSLATLFSGMNFQGTVQKYCQQIGWKIAEIDNKHAVLLFTMESGREQRLYIIRYDTTLEFSVPSMAKFDSDDDIPDALSTLLLKRNAQSKVGFWCIEEIRGSLIYSCMHNAEIELLNTSYFERVVRVLIEECDDFEGILIQMMRR